MVAPRFLILLMNGKSQKIINYNSFRYPNWPIVIVCQAVGFAGGNLYQCLINPDFRAHVPQAYKSLFA